MDRAGAPDRGTLLFMVATAVYFVLQAVLRIQMGGSLEVDEAEMLLMSQDWRLGYGPQLPLYNWAQVAAFGLFGPTTAGLALLKAAVLWLAAAGLWCAMHQGFDDRRAAAAAALSLAFLPNVLWEFQRASSHSIAMLAAVTWALWAWFRVRARGGMRDWLVLGVIWGLGGLSKANFWAVPVSLLVASWGLWPRPKGTDRAGMAVALMVAAAIVAVPYGWALWHPAQTLASVHKFYAAGQVPSVAGGLILLTGNVAAGLALGVVVAAGLWLASGRRALGPMPMAARMMLRAALVNLGVAALLVVAFGVTKVQSRWLVPMLVLAMAGGFGWLASGLTRRALLWVPGLAALCGVLTIAGMVQVRGGATARLDFAPLVALVQRMAPDAVEAGYFVGGNLRLLTPGLPIAVTGTARQSGAWPARLLVLEGADLPPGVAVADQGQLVLSYPGKSQVIDWQLWATTGPNVPQMTPLDGQSPQTTGKDSP